MRPLSIAAQLALGAGALLVLAAVVLPWYRYTAEISGNSEIQIATSAQSETLAQASIGIAIIAVFGAGLALAGLIAAGAWRSVALALAWVGTLVVVLAIALAVAGKPAGPDDAKGLDRSFRTIDVQTDTALRAGAYVGIAGAFLIFAGTAGFTFAGPPPAGRD